MCVCVIYINYINYSITMSDYKDPSNNALSTLLQGSITGITANQPTNYKNSADEDLGTRYLKGNSGNIKGVYGKDTGYTVKNSDGDYVDLGRLFEAALPFTAPNTNIAIQNYIFGTTAATDTQTTRYCYVIHTRVDDPTTFTVNKECTLNIICVGGGGGGGSPRDGQSCGGGGGGGVYKTTLVVSAGYVIKTRTGAGGLRGGVGNADTNPDGVGDAGGESYVQYARSSTGSYTIKITSHGGGGGTPDGPGTGGGVTLSGTYLTTGNGGNGGDQTDGYSSYYSNNQSRSLEIPSVLINDQSSYIFNYYSGGGGGSRGDTDGRNWKGGNGGGNSEKNGNGGTRGANAVNSDGSEVGKDGFGYGGGGGSGGQGSGGTKFRGGSGRQGIVIIWAEI